MVRGWFGVTIAKTSDSVKRISEVASTWERRGCLSISLKVG